MLRRDQHEQQAGQTLVFTALVLAFAGVPLLALQGDVSIVDSENGKANMAAFQGATTATQVADLAAVNGPLLSTSQLRLDERAAARKCEETIRRVDPGADPTCTVANGTVTAVVSKHVQLPVPIPFGLFSTVGGEWSAQTTLGTVTPY